MKKTYRIRANSPADYIVRAVPYLILVGAFILCGVLNSWELGLL